MSCYQWFSYVDDQNCLGQALLLNHWATEDEMAGLVDADKKNLLMNNLNKFLDPEIHTFIDLSMRDVSGGAGSLCGMAAFYQALVSTILTKSQLKQYSYDAMKVAVADEMKKDPKKARKEKDANLLTAYYNCKYVFLWGYKKFKRYFMEASRMFQGSVRVF